MADKYRPGTGTEGVWFFCRFCAKCKRDAEYQRTRNGDDGCKIAADVLCFPVDHPSYPKEWVYDETGLPTCAAFVHVDEPYYTSRCTRTVDMFQGSEPAATAISPKP